MVYPNKGDYLSAALMKNIKPPFSISKRRFESRGRRRMNVRWCSQFKKDYRLMMKQQKDIGKLDYIIEEPTVPNPLAEQYRDHYLKGDNAWHKECHIESDWLFIYDYETLDDGSSSCFSSERVRTRNYSINPASILKWSRPL